MALINSANPASISYRDAGNEISTFRIFGADITAENLDDQEALWDAVVTAANALCLGQMVRNRYVNDTTYTTTQPTNGAAREIKLLIQAQVTTTGRRLTATLPTLNPTLPAYVININAKDIVRLDTPSTITALITALNAFWVDPDTNTLATTVVGLKVVGRRN